jgi:hypothetical protein
MYYYYIKYLSSLVIVFYVKIDFVFSIFNENNITLNDEHLGTTPALSAAAAI